MDIKANKMSSPKVLIFGQPFNTFSGGGITLTNLFRGWAKDKIAVAYMGHGLYTVTTDVCDTYYQLGIEEYKWVFPFNLIQRQFPSGLKTFDQKAVAEPIFYIQKGIRYSIVNKVFYPFLRWAGLSHSLCKIILSKKFKIWLSEYKPEILYLQVSNREEIEFAKVLINFLKIPSVIHIMDDWPTTISNKGILKNFWYKKIDTEFKQLLNQVDLHLSISDAMSEEYMRRYNKMFTAFHNPIETELWLPYCKTSFRLDKRHISILYSGRIGIGITDSLYEIASAIDLMNNTELNIKLYIQTPAENTDILNRLQSYKCIVINPFAAYEQLPKIFSDADILLLANDFSKSAMDYLRYSMPTKASEFMISGTPILIYAPSGAAVTTFFIKNECGYCVSQQNPDEIIKRIQYLISNEEYRKKISFNAVSLAKDKFSTEKVRKEFQGLLINLIQKQK